MASAESKTSGMSIVKKLGIVVAVMCVYSFFYDLLKKNNNTDVYLSYSQAKDINLVTEPPGIPVLQLKIKRQFTFKTRDSSRQNTAGVWEEYCTKKKKEKIEKKKKKKFNDLHKKPAPKENV